jgi:hypothetical protein
LILRVLGFGPILPRNGLEIKRTGRETHSGEYAEEIGGYRIVLAVVPVNLIAVNWVNRYNTYLLFSALHFSPHSVNQIISGNHAR